MVGYTQEQIGEFVLKHKPFYAHTCITNEGFYDADNTINLCDILTELIHSAGRWCERYASDLFIEWNSVLKSINEERSETRLIGFREDGVDHTPWVLNSYTDRYSERNYRALYSLEIRFFTDDYGYQRISVTLEKLNH